MSFVRGARTSRGLAALSSVDAKPVTASGSAELGARLLPNERKNSSTDADFYGVLLIDDREYRVRVWCERYPDGTEWLKLRLNPKATV